jgi:acyl-CoA thioesterase-1
MRVSMSVSYGTSFAAVEGWLRTFACLLFAGWLVMLPQAPVFAQAGAKPLKLVVLGDSLSAGYNLPGPAAFPVRLQKALTDKGIAVEIANAGVSGDTTSGGLGRLDWSVPDGTQGVILELGANDALRGVDPKIPREALTEIIKRLQARGITAATMRTSSTRSIQISPNSSTCRSIRFFSMAWRARANSICPTACIRPRKASMSW